MASLPDSNPYPRSPRSRTSSVHRSRRNSLLGHAEPAPSSTQTSSTHSYFTSPGRELSSDQNKSLTSSAPLVQITPPVSLPPDATTWDSPMARERKNSEVSLGSQKKGSHPMLKAALEAAKAPFERRRSMSGSSFEGATSSPPAKTTLLEAQSKDDAERKKMDEKATRKLSKAQGMTRRLSIGGGGGGSDSEASMSDSGKPKRFNTLSRVFSYRRKKSGSVDQASLDGSSSVKSNSSPTVQVETGVTTDSPPVVASQEELTEGVMSPVEEESSRAISPAQGESSSKDDGAVHLESPLASPALGAQFQDVSLTAYAGATLASIENKEAAKVANDDVPAIEVPGAASAISQGSWIHVPTDEDAAATSTQEIREGKTKLQVVDDEEDAGSYADEEGSVLGHTPHGPSLVASIKEKARSTSPPPKDEITLASPVTEVPPGAKGKEVAHTAPLNDFTPPMTPASTKFSDTEPKSTTFSASAESAKAATGSAPKTEKEKSALSGFFSHPLLSRPNAPADEKKTTNEATSSSGPVELSNYIPSRETVDTAAQYATQNRPKNQGATVDSTRRQSAVSSNNHSRRVSIMTTPAPSISSGSALAPPINLRHSQSQPLRSHDSDYGDWYHGSRSSNAPEPTAEELYPEYPSYRRERVASKASSFSSTVTAAELARRAAASPHHRALLSSQSSREDMTIPFVPSWVPVPYIVVWSWQAFSFTVESGFGIAIMAAGIATGTFRVGAGVGLGVVRFGLNTMSRAAGALRRTVGF
ncbi:hypothetical protein FRC02_001299 [Tulasnella sp. 418]|nr:hypothetical protein FRC02_001299 [Tulasnella sp. 418]